MTKSCFEFGSGLKINLYLIIHNRMSMLLKTAPMWELFTESMRAGWGCGSWSLG